MKEIKTPQKPLLYYYLMAMLILMLFNAFVSPFLFQNPTQQVGYSDFMDQVDLKQVEQVEFKDGYIYYTKPGDETTYFTGEMAQDTQIIPALRASGAKFTQIVPQEPGFLQSFLTTWVLPILFFVLIGQLLSRWMMKRMNQNGGNPVMTFGGGA